MTVNPSLEFIEFISISEDDALKYETLVGSYAIMQVGDDILFAFN